MLRSPKLWIIVAGATGALAGLLRHGTHAEQEKEKIESIAPSITTTHVELEASASPPIRMPRAKNLILITIDTVRADELDAMPRVRALAEKSVVFERAYAIASYTGKSLGPMLIGKYPSETDRDGNHFTTYAASNTFLAERLHDHGFRTLGAASHWYFQSWSGLSQGMDEWSTNARPVTGQGENDTSITSVELTNEAIRLLSKPDNVSGRFFAWFHYLDPHAQYMPHEEVDPSEAGTNGAAIMRELYRGELRFTDRHVGRLLDHIESQPWAAETAIIVTSDHGEAFGEHGMSWHGIELWEPLVRVPLFIYVPQTESRRVPTRRSTIDLVPTVLDLLGIPIPREELSGRSLIPDVMGTGEPRDILFDMPAGPYNARREGIISGSMKLVRGDGILRLYDVDADGSEERELSETMDVVQRLNAAREKLASHDVAPGDP